MTTHKIKIRKDLKDIVIKTEDKRDIIIEHNKEYESITVNCSHDDITAIFIEGAWHEVNNIDFE